MLLCSALLCTSFCAVIGEILGTPHAARASAPPRPAFPRLGPVGGARQVQGGAGAGVRSTRAGRGVTLCFPTRAWPCWSWHVAGTVPRVAGYVAAVRVMPLPQAGIIMVNKNKRETPTSRAAAGRPAGCAVRQLGRTAAPCVCVRRVPGVAATHTVSQSVRQAGSRPSEAGGSASAVYVHGMCWQCRTRVFSLMFRIYIYIYIY